ncbi:MAG: hypothetical protein ABEJ70_01355 [Halobacteriaceae archaeon]
MAVGPYLVSTLLMGLLLVAIAASARTPRRTDWRARPRLPSGDGAAAWTTAVSVDRVVAAAGLVLVVGGLAAVAAGGATAQTAGLAFAAVVVACLAGYLVWGTYAVARARGLHRAGAAAVGAWAAGMLVVVAVLIRLLTA